MAPVAGTQNFSPVQDVKTPPSAVDHEPYPLDCPKAPHGKNKLDRFCDENDTERNFHLYQLILLNKSKRAYSFITNSKTRSFDIFIKISIFRPHIPEDILKIKNFTKRKIFT